LSVAAPAASMAVSACATPEKIRIKTKSREIILRIGILSKKKLRGVY
jgi:hypothetical protein